MPDNIGIIIITVPHFAVIGAAVLTHGEQDGIVYLVTIGVIIMDVLDMIFTITFGLITLMILLLCCHAIHIAPVALAHGRIHLVVDAGIETAIHIDGLHGTPQQHI